MVPLYLCCSGSSVIGQGLRPLKADASAQISLQGSETEATAGLMLEGTKEDTTFPLEGFFNCLLFNNIALVGIPFSHYKGSEVGQSIVSRVALHIFWPKDRPIYYLQ